jgi:hypothetical protein
MSLWIRFAALAQVAKACAQFPLALDHVGDVNAVKSAA